MSSLSLPPLDGATGRGRMEGPDVSEAQWYFSREEVEKSPSRKDGIDAKKETFLRRSYCTFCQALGMRLKVPQLVIATAIVFCHRFYLRQSHAKNDRSMVATVCMFIACKVEENPRQLKELVQVAYLLRYEKDLQQAAKIKQKEVMEEHREMVLVGERLVLATLGFDLNVSHPYKPLINFAKKMSIEQTLVQVAWNFINDGLRTSLSLQYRPQLIAAGALYLAAKFLKKDLPVVEGKEWYEIYLEGLPEGSIPGGSSAAAILKVVMDVSNQMLELYEHSKGGGVSRSGDPSHERSKREGRRAMSLSLVGPARSGSTLGPARTERTERGGEDGPCSPSAPRSAPRLPGGRNGQRLDAAEGDSGSVRPPEDGAARAEPEGVEGREAGGSRPSTSAEGRLPGTAERDEDRGDRQGNGHSGEGASGREADVAVKKEEALPGPKVEADLDDDAIEAMLEAPLEPASVRKPKGANKEALLSLLGKSKPVPPLGSSSATNGDKVVKTEEVNENPDTKRRRLGADNDSRASPYRRATPEHTHSPPRPPLNPS